MSTSRLDAVDKGLPRRLSVIPDTTAYDKAAHRLSGRIAVLLDGTELPEVAAWDVDEGFVLRRRRAKDGSFILDQAGTPTHETLNGRVEVRWAAKDGAA